MNKIYEDAKDVYVKYVNIYSNDGEYAYADSDCTVKLSAKELVDAFCLGAIIHIGFEAYKPISVSAKNGITYVKSKLADPTTAILATLKFG